MPALTEYVQFSGKHEWWYPQTPRSPRAYTQSCLRVKLQPQVSATMSNSETRCSWIPCQLKQAGLGILYIIYYNSVCHGIKHIEPTSIQASGEGEITFKLIKLLLKQNNVIWCSLFTNICSYPPCTFSVPSLRLGENFGAFFASPLRDSMAIAAKLRGGKSPRCKQENRRKHLYLPLERIPSYRRSLFVF